MICIQTGPLGVNTYIVKLTGSSVFIVDSAACDFCRDGNRIVDFLKDNDFNPVAMVFTHGHFDHVAGINNLRKEYPKIPLLIHRKDSSMINPKENAVQIDMLRSMGFEIFVSSISNLGVADITLEDKDTLDKVLSSYVSDPECLDSLSKWSVIHTPGHTPGSICLYNQEQKILISGDTVFYQSYGRTDFPGGNEQEMIDSLRIIYSQIPSDVKVYPGHDYYGFMLKDNL